MTSRQVISIHGVPRSGTSWLGQIFNKHSEVVYKFQPLFAYRFKDRLSLGSSPDEIRAFLDELYKVNDDDFISGKWPPSNNDPARVNTAIYKNEQPRVMVLKEVRYHHLIEKFICAVPDLKIVGIVRNPCAVINSWLQSPKEFHGEWDVMAEWEHAPAKNQGRIEEYFGYAKWKELTLVFLGFIQKYPENFFLVQYEELVLEPVKLIEQVFAFGGLNMEAQVVDFIQASQNHHVDDAYAVYKSPSVKDRWRHELDPRISEAIITDLQGTMLERFLA